MRADVAQAPAEQRDPAVCEPPVGLELRLTGAARADAAADLCGAAPAREPLEVLPHASHPREVVFELREFDLELPLGRDGVLREDVEDQLRAVDHSRRERILERPLLRRLELLVDDQHLGARLPVGGLQLLELPLADVGPRVGPCPMLDDVPHRCDTGRARKLAELPELVFVVGAVRKDGEQQAALGLELALGIGHRHRRKYAPLPPRGRLAGMSALPERLARRTLELVDIPSESLHEARIRETVRGLVPEPFALVFEGDEAFLWARERREDVPFLVLAGHYDTVPAQDNLPGRIAGGAVHGCGASDMKGGVAVAVELVRELATLEPGPVDVGLLLFGREELPPEHDPLPAVFDACPLARDADLAVLLEPTGLAIQAGCLGNVSATVTFHGVSGHSARPWLAENAIHAAIEGLARVATHERREAVIDGLPFYEVVSVTRVSGGVADNVVPDQAVATVNLRYPPDRTPGEAEELLRSLVPTDTAIEILGNSPPGAVAVDAPLVRALQSVGNFPIEAKQAWTNVADFTARGVPAVNFGPGAPAYAHRRDELVEIDSLERAYQALRRLALGDSTVD